MSQNLDFSWGQRFVTRCRAPHDRQKPRRLQLKATSLLWPQSPQRNRKKPWARTPQSREASNSARDELRQVGAGGGFSYGEEGRGMLLHKAVQRGLFRAVALVVNRGAIRRPLGLLHLACTRGSRGCDLGRS